jgi:hypothetical protein
VERSETGIPETHWDTRTPLGMGLGFYISSPLKMGMGIPELYGFGFGERKIRPRPASLPCLLMPASATESTKVFLWKCFKIRPKCFSQTLGVRVIQQLLKFNTIYNNKYEYLSEAINKNTKYKNLFRNSWISRPHYCQVHKKKKLYRVYRIWQWQFTPFW